jgi:photosystem II stability/assembly factor-like uncharacterized protein
LAVVLVLSPSPATAQDCVGDCNGDGEVTVDEIITGVGIALGDLPVENCTVFDGNGDGSVTVDEILVAVANALDGCSEPPPPWLLFNPSPTGENVFSVDFIDPQRGWASSSFGDVLHTTDGGQTWDFQSTNTIADLFAITFVDADFGWTAGLDPETDGGVILQTQNGGDTWQRQPLNTDELLNDVAFADRSSGWAVGTGGLILRSTDGGP